MQESEKLKTEAKKDGCSSTSRDQYDGTVRMSLGYSFLFNVLTATLSTFTDYTGLAYLPCIDLLRLYADPLKFDLYVLFVNESLPWIAILHGIEI